jgi:glucose/arabinose dehydrogenase
MNHAQDPDSKLGKLLRIDPTQAGATWQVAAVGLRNPWRFSFDTATGRLFVGDVGQDKFEEVDLVTRGNNLGWNVMEATHCFNPPSGCNMAGLTLPIAEYSHSEGNAVMGGYVYHGSSIPALQNAYVFGDFGSGNIWMLTQSAAGTWTRTLLLASGLNISSFGQDTNGEMFVVDYSGKVWQIAAQ